MDYNAEEITKLTNNQIIDQVTTYKVGVALIVIRDEIATCLTVEDDGDHSLLESLVTVFNFIRDCNER